MTLINRTSSISDTISRNFCLNYLILIYFIQYDIILDPEGLLADIIKEVDKFKHVHETVMTEIQQVVHNNFQFHRKNNVR